MDELPAFELFGRRLDEAMRARARRQRRAAAAAPALAAAVAVVLVLLGGRGGPTPSFAARAYVAARPSGIVHWRYSISFTVAGRRTAQRQAVEGWTGLGRSHVLRFERFGRGPLVLKFDAVTRHRRTRYWTRGADDYATMPAPAPAPPRAVGQDGLPTGDPVEGFRSAFRQGRLRRVGPESYALDVIPRRHWSTSGRLTVTYAFDRATARVRRIVSVSTPAKGSTAPLSRMILDVERYEHLPVTAASRRSLDLRAHPGAGPTPIDAADHFVVLRDGAVPDARTMATLRKATSNGPRVVELATGRMIDATRVLAAGPSHLCLFLTDAGGVGTVCRTTKIALRRGISAGTPTGGTTLIVPDDVTSVRAPKEPHGYADYKPRRGVVRWPKIGGAYTLRR